MQLAITSTVRHKVGINTVSSETNELIISKQIKENLLDELTL
jgi:hypothetical protein